MSTPIGGKLYKLDNRPLKERQSAKPLTREQLEVLVTDGWADVAMVAYILQVSPTTISKWIKQKKIKAGKSPANRWYIPLNQFMNMFDVPSAEVLYHKARRFSGPHPAKLPRSLRFTTRAYNQEMKKLRNGPTNPEQE